MTNATPSLSAIQFEVASELAQPPADVVVILKLAPEKHGIGQPGNQAGDIVPANITAIQRYGAFARLKEGVEGLIHVSTIHLPSGRKDLESYCSGFRNKVQCNPTHYIDSSRQEAADPVQEQE